MNISKIITAILSQSMNLVIGVAIISSLLLGGCAKTGATTAYDVPHNRIIASNGVRDVYDRDVVAEIIIKDKIRRELNGGK